MAVRIAVIQARNVPRAVVFRRGPSKQVLMCLWHTDTDAVEEGQWLKGRVYERRCDLSPNGERLVYFAANYKPPLYSWTAVSRPPFFTAVSLWGKGDAWGGGGLFSSDRELLLNHRGAERRLAKGFRVPLRVRTKSIGEWAGWGEDDPIWSERIKRDGWILRNEGKKIAHPYGSPRWFEFSPPAQWSRSRPGPSPSHELWMNLHGIKELGGSWYIESYQVRAGAEVICELGRCDWADWASNGDVLFAKQGRLLRLRLSSHGSSVDPRDATCVADLNDRTFLPIEAPSFAKSWYGTRPT